MQIAEELAEFIAAGTCCTLGSFPQSARVVHPLSIGRLALGMRSDTGEKPSQQDVEECGALPAVQLHPI
jgi:hypothetical protein